MTTPTQSQIEAGPHLEEVMDYLINKKGFTIDGAYKCARTFLETMQFVRMNTLAAAADVGLPTADDVKGILKPDWLHPPTIERCAQVAYEWLRMHGYLAEAGDCVAAIKALKDQP